MLFTVSEVSKLLKVNKNYVYKLINSGLLTSIIVGSRKVREETLKQFLADYDGQDIDVLIEQRELQLKGE